MPRRDETNQMLAVRWYEGVTRAQWIVLVIASLGWIFDVFEGQIFVASMQEAIPSLVEAGTSQGTIDWYNNLCLAAFLVGGAAGGVVFGMIGDRVGRKKALTWTILTYSVFTAVSACALNWWHLAIFRFLVAMGVGGEWAVASALVAEVFPTRARAWSLGIFHASSVLGTYLAILAGAFIVGNPALQTANLTSLPWRLGFVLGALPALLVFWVRRSIDDSETWKQCRQSVSGSDDPALEAGRARGLFEPALARRTFVGVGLASVGLATFWGVHIHGKDLLRRDIEIRYLANTVGGRVPVGLSGVERAQRLQPHLPAIKRWEMLGMFLVTTGGGLGLLSFGPLCERIGRRSTFLVFHLGALLISIVSFQGVEGVNALIVVLPILGFLTLGMHAGYAIYFPELFPTRLRGTGAGFCFNVGRLAAAPVLIVQGWLRNDAGRGGWGLSMESAATMIALLFLVGVAILPFAPETKGRGLPEDHDLNPPPR